MWTYTHKAGIISVAGWGNPFLVITEDKYWKGQHWGYNYYRLGISFPTELEASKEADKINRTYGLPLTFTSKGSEDLLMKLQSDFPTASIAKNPQEVN